MLKRIAWILNGGMALCLLLSYLAPYVDPLSFSWLSFMGLFYPVFLCMNVLFVLLWLIKWDKRVFLSLACILMGYVFIPRFIALFPKEKASNTSSISIATYNVENARRGYDRDRTKRKAKREKLEAFHHKLRHLDILCIQEKGDFAFDILKDVYNEHEIHMPENKGTAILSRFPVINKGSIEFGTRTNSCIWADIVSPMDTIRVYSLHLQSNQITNDTKALVKNGNLQEEETWKGIGGIFDKFRHHHIKRAMQSNLVKEHMEKAPYPVILGGDFNDTPMSFTYTTLSKNMLDSFIEQGSGLGTTYSDNVPFLRIDFILTDPAFSILSHQVEYADYSDHYPVIAEITSNKN